MEFKLLYQGKLAGEALFDLTNQIETGYPLALLGVLSIEGVPSIAFGFLANRDNTIELSQPIVLDLLNQEKLSNQFTISRASFGGILRVDFDAPNIKGYLRGHFNGLGEIEGHIHAELHGQDFHGYMHGDFDGFSDLEGRLRAEINAQNIQGHIQMQGEFIGRGFGEFHLDIDQSSLHVDAIGHGPFFHMRLHVRTAEKEDVINQSFFSLLILTIRHHLRRRDTNSLDVSLHSVISPIDPENLHILPQGQVEEPQAMLAMMAQQELPIAAQTIEFMQWLLDKHPNLDILASVPIVQVREMVMQFCEEQNYKNAVSFSQDVVRWLQGKAEHSILRFLISLGTTAKMRNNTHRINVAPLNRYKTISFHAMFLFLSAGNFPGFIEKYWEDLNHLTGDLLDIYYSYDDIERRVSAFEVLEQFRSLQVDATALPAILLWEGTLASSGFVPLEGLSHDDVFSVMKLIVQHIKEGKNLQEICDDANELVKFKLEALTPGTKIIVNQGGVQMSNDTYNVQQAGAVGPNAHAHDMTFTQIGNQIAQSVDLSKLAGELSTLRQAMKKEATEPEQDIAVGEIGKAEQAAKAKDTSKVAEHLKAAGKWALDVAIAVGVPVAIEALKKSLSLG